MAKASYYLRHKKQSNDIEKSQIAIELDKKLTLLLREWSEGRITYEVMRRSYKTGEQKILVEGILPQNSTR